MISTASTGTFGWSVAFSAGARGSGRRKAGLKRRGCFSREVLQQRKRHTAHGHEHCSVVFVGDILLVNAAALSPSSAPTRSKLTLFSSTFQTRTQAMSRTVSQVKLEDLFQLSQPGVDFARAHTNEPICFFFVFFCSVFDPIPSLEEHFSCPNQVCTACACAQMILIVHAQFMMFAFGSSCISDFVFAISEKDNRISVPVLPWSRFHAPSSNCGAVCATWLTRWPSRHLLCSVQVLKFWFACATASTMGFLQQLELPTILITSSQVPILW